MITRKLFLCVLVLMLAVALAACKKQESSAPIKEQGGAVSPITVDNEVKFLMNVLKEDPKNINALIKLGNLMMDTKRFQEAVVYYDQALKIEPNNVDVRVDMGSCYRYLKMPSKAIEAYKKAISINPKHLFARKNLAIVLTYDIGDTLNGVKEFEAYLALSPNDPDAPQIRQEIARIKQSKK